MMPTTERWSEPQKESNSAQGRVDNVVGDRHSPKPLRVVSSLIRSCLCANGGNVTTFTERKGMDPSKQFVELQGIRFIGLGAVVDELTPRQRVYDTLETFRTKSERLVSIGYLLDRETSNIGSKPPLTVGKIVETVPYDTWVRDCAELSFMSRDVRLTVEYVKNKQFTALSVELAKQLQRLTKHLSSGQNIFLVGITAHNLAVAKILAGDDLAAEELFRQAIELKEITFGPQHPEVALSRDELGIQLFARGDFVGALLEFEQVHRDRSLALVGDTTNPILAVTLNNIACCKFQLGQYSSALHALYEARSIQQHAIGSSVQDDLDLLHVAIVYSNCGYLHLALKEYDEARSILEEALLLQQSVLDDSHRAVRDTLSNIEFANAFHS